MRLFAYLLARFSEPSSYAGIGAILALMGWHFADSTIGEIVQFLAAGCALLALALKERGLISAIVILVATAPALGGCGALVAAGAASGSVGGALAIAEQVSGTIESVIAGACYEYGRERRVADAAVAAGVVPTGAAAKVVSIESFGDAACADPPKGDPLSTAIWLGRLTGQITTLLDSAAPPA